ncbi:RagB/SusD family nutrient uptake outer membrane protein [Gemmatimonas sp.]|uniref:RagB/SusD family nutrient uptake outer membrane protein n=1 Tax=Gemmatimonas sp. TaxID=1962908 RepID=UPI0035640A8B
MRTSITSRRALTPRRMLGVVAPLGVLAALSGCALDAVNPGPIRAEALNNPSALSSLVNGAGRDLSEALNWTAYTGGAVSREIFPGGSTGAFGISVQQQSGKLSDDDGGNWWNFSQRARWTSEDAVSRIKTVLGTASANNVTLAQALVWAGYANRHLGENFCQGVINGGAPGPHTVYFERAEANFTEAIAVATAANNTNLAQAATAGRASVRLLRNNTAGAATDAAAVPNTYAYRMPYYQTELDQNNRIFWASANQPYRAHTVWNTYIETHRRATRDPRVPFDSSLTQLVGDAAVGALGRVRWYFQTKHSSITAPINLSTGWEMRLIEAEVKLVASDLAGALTSMNLRRTSLSLPAITASNLTEGWAALKRERGIELWLESRRLGDLRRWAALSRPGALDPKEEIPGRDLCFATPLSEKETNINFIPR